MLEQLAAGFGVGLLAGLTSIPHCAAMCGPVAALVCSRRRTATAPLRYQLGRVLGYAFMGLLAGQLGAVLGGPRLGDPARWVFRGLIAVSCLLLAYGLWKRAAARPTDLLPVQTVTRKRPLTRRVASLLPGEPLALGGLTALLPCGALYASLLLSAGSADAGQGAALMMGFATTTGLPLMAVGATLRLRALAPGRSGARALAVLLVLAAGVSTLEPLVRAHDASGDAAPMGAPAPACH
ncbi:MAG: sulfite exporter TauE/SafE family protein [Myxococcales bacterium]|nr:sulfite exporter TauE/SafE family protein [Myxococcales bacterium]